MKTSKQCPYHEAVECYTEDPCEDCEIYAIYQTEEGLGMIRKTHPKCPTCVNYKPEINEKDIHEPPSCGRLYKYITDEFYCGYHNI